MKELIGKAMQKGLEQLGYLLSEREEQIFEALRDAHAEHEGDTFHFPIGLQIKLTPRGSIIEATAKVSYGVRYTTTAEPVVVDGQPDLFDNEPPKIPASGSWGDDLLKAAQEWVADRQEVGLTSIQRQFNLNSMAAQSLLDLLVSTGSVTYAEAGKYTVCD